MASHICFGQSNMRGLVCFSFILHSELIPHKTTTSCMRQTSMNSMDLKLCTMVRSVTIFRFSLNIEVSLKTDLIKRTIHTRHVQLHYDKLQPLLNESLKQLDIYQDLVYKSLKQILYRVLVFCPTGKMFAYAINNCCSPCTTINTGGGFFQQQEGNQTTVSCIDSMDNIAYWFLYMCQNSEFLFSAIITNLIFGRH